MQKILGVNPLLPATAVAEHELGLVVDDPRGGAFAGNKFKYVKAMGTIVAFDAVSLDVTATAAERDFSIVQAPATPDLAFEGISVTPMNTTTLRFGFIQIEGRVNGANVADAATAGATLATSATAGRLAAPATPATAAINMHGGRGVKALTDGDANNRADVLLY